MQKQNRDQFQTLVLSSGKGLSLLLCLVFIVAIVQVLPGWPTANSAVPDSPPPPRNEPPVAEIAVSQSVGTAPVEITFDARPSSDADGYIAQYDWDLDGDGSYEITNGSAIVSYTYSSKGEYTVSLLVYDDYGWTATTSTTISVIDLQIMDLTTQLVPGFAPIEMEVEGGQFELLGNIVERYPIYGDSFEAFSLANINGTPSICFITTEGNRTSSVNYISAIDNQGFSWEYRQLAINRDCQGLYSPRLIEVSGNPAIAYAEKANSGYHEFHFIRSKDSNGGSWAKPVTVETLPGNNDIVRSLSVCLVNGWPALAYLKGFGNSPAYFERAMDSYGNNWSSPSLVVEPHAYGLSLAVINRIPTIIARGTPYGNPPSSRPWDYSYIVASDINGLSQWQAAKSVLQSWEIKYYSSNKVELLDAGGSPIIAWFSEKMSQNQNSSDSFPAFAYYTGWEWKGFDAIPNSGQGDLIDFDFALVGGIPHIAYLKDTSPQDQLWIIKAKDPQGHIWESARLVSTDVKPTDQSFDNDLCLIDAGGLPGILVTEASSYALKYILVMN